MLTRRRRRRVNIKTTLGGCLVLAGLSTRDLASQTLHPVYTPVPRRAAVIGVRGAFDDGVPPQMAHLVTISVEFTFWEKAITEPAATATQYPRFVNEPGIFW